MPTNEALVAEVKGRDEAFWLNYWLAHWRQEGRHAPAEAERERWFRQMWDVSQFMPHSLRLRPPCKGLRWRRRSFPMVLPGRLRPS